MEESAYSGQANAAAAPPTARPAPPRARQSQVVYVSQTEAFAEIEKVPATSSRAPARALAPSSERQPSRPSSPPARPAATAAPAADAETDEVDEDPSLRFR